jgi:p25-alpha
VLAVAGAATIPDAVAFHDDKNLYTGVHGKGGPTINDNTISLSNLADRSGADVRGIKAANKETSIADTLAELTVGSGSPRRVSAATTAAATPSPRKSSGAVSPGPRSTAAAAAAPVHSGGDTEGRVHAVFLAFCSSVAKQCYEADSAKFFKLCSDCGLVDGRLSRTQCDLIFTRAAVQKRMSYEAFRHQAVAMIAEQRGVSEAAVLQAVAATQGISSSGTVAEPSRFHDDKSEFFAHTLQCSTSAYNTYISLVVYASNVQ